MILGPFPADLGPWGGVGAVCSAFEGDLGPFSVDLGPFAVNLGRFAADLGQLWQN